MKTQTLKPNPRNPRRVKQSKLDKLSHSLEYFGDLGCVIYNIQTQQLVGGHQRVAALPPDTEIVIEHKYKKPTEVGTVAEGYLKLNNGEKLKYREVKWNKVKEDAANIAANNSVGEWVTQDLSAMLRGLDEFNSDMGLTLFDDAEILKIHSKVDKAVKAVEVDEDIPAPKPKSKVQCPSCGEKFSLTFGLRDNE